jgi:DNA polymerase
MDTLVVDLETFYAKDYSLTKLTTQEYIDDPRFETIGLAVKKNKEPTQSFSGTHEEVRHWLYSFPWATSIGVAHNAMFDFSILSWKFGIHPKLIADTLSMGRALRGMSVGGSLKALAEYYGVGVKGDEVLNAIGKRREDFTEEELERYMEYCRNDVDLTYELFLRMAPSFNAVEMKLIDMTVRMHSEPMFQLDRFVLEQHLLNVQENKEKLLIESGLTGETLRSDGQLAEALRMLHVEPPTKISARTGKEAYAFAKSDEAFKAMLEHDDPRVQAIVAARLGVKTTIEESRTERFISIHDAGGALPVPLQYYKAMTGRWAGSEKINLQNLPRTSPLKKAIVAPLGYVIVGADICGAGRQTKDAG